MEYSGYATLDDLLRDERATEFRAIVREIPVTLTKQVLLEWSEPGWSGEYQSALTAFKGLVDLETDYDAAMAQVRSLQQTMSPAEQVEQTQEQAQEQAHEPVSEPGEAAAEVMRTITVAAIERLQQQYPDVAARFTPEQIQAAALNATATAVSQVGE